MRDGDGSEGASGGISGRLAAPVAVVVVFKALSLRDCLTLLRAIAP